MAMMINVECIACDACLLECPNNAISEGEEIYVINPDLCNECVGFADAPQCVDVCPADCIIKDLNHAQNKEQADENNRKVHINW